jgi:hypothetical protein
MTRIEEKSMGYNKEYLSKHFQISIDQLDLDIKACDLNVHKDDYSSEELDTLQKYRDLIAPFEELRNRFSIAILSKGEKSPHQVLEEFLQKETADSTDGSDEEDASSDDSQPTPKKSLRKKKKPMALFDLLKEGQKKTDKPITLSRGIELLGACGLPEKSEYSPEEVEKFLVTCDRIINQGHSLAQVATDNGVKTTGSLWERTNTLGVQRSQQVVETMSDTFAVVDEQICQVFEQSYLQNLEESLSNGNFDEAYERARQRIRAQNGPSPFEQITAQFQLRQAQERQHRQKLIQQTPEPPQLPPE